MEEMNDPSLLSPYRGSMVCIYIYIYIYIRVRGFPERDILSLRTLGLGLARFGRPSAGAARPNFPRSEIPGNKLLGWDATWGTCLTKSL